MSVAYRSILNSNEGGSSTGVTGMTPLGTIISFYGETAPHHYLICDGTAYNKTDYPELANHLLDLTNHTQYEVDGDNTKFKVPDLRGEFLRGTGTNSHTNQGSGADVGVHQDATKIPAIYTHHDGQFGVAEVSTSTDYSLRNADSSDGTRQYVSELNFSAKHVTAPYDIDAGYSTIRPTTTSVLYCIAYKDIYTNPADSYSTTEKVIGTWIDGSPIYQKTVEINNPATNWSAITLVNEAVSNARKIDAQFERSGVFNSEFFNSTSDFVACGVFCGSTLDCRIQQAGNSGITKAVITVQYTKTTD